MSDNFDPIERMKNSIINEKEHRSSEFIVAIVFNLIFFYIVNNLLNWNISFIASSWGDILWIINLSIAVNIVINVLFILYHPGWFRDSMQIILNIVGFVVVYLLYIVFPFNFSQNWITYGLQFLLILAMIVLPLVTVYLIFKLVLRGYMKSQG